MTPCETKNQHQTQSRAKHELRMPSLARSFGNCSGPAKKARRTAKTIAARASGTAKVENEKIGGGIIFRHVRFRSVIAGGTDFQWMIPAPLGKSAQWRTAQAGLKNTEHISFNVLVTVKASRRQVLLFQGQEE